MRLNQFLATFVSFLTFVTFIPEKMAFATHDTTATTTATPHSDSNLSKSCPYMGSNHSVLSKRFHNIGFTLCEEHFATGSENYLAMLFVIDTLNSLQGTDLYFYIKGLDKHHNYSDVSSVDGVTRIDITEEGCTNSGDCSFSGRTFPHLNKLGAIKEFDIALNEEVNWNPNMPTSWESDGYTYLRALLLHEIGHGLGLDHTAGTIDELSIMGALMGKWVANKLIDMKSFDHSHLRYHYPLKGSKSYLDFALSNYKTLYSSESDTYTCVLNEGISPQDVLAGDSVNLTWTFFNMGIETNSNAILNVFLSKDNQLDETDYLIDTQEFEDLGEDGMTSYMENELIIPAEMESGEYYVFLNVLPQSNFTDYRLENNTMPISVTLYIQ